jgi:hypothetical protein
MARVSAQEAADAINSILRFDSEDGRDDRAALLEVLDQYFYSPGLTEDTPTLERGEKVVL